MNTKLICIFALLICIAIPLCSPAAASVVVDECLTWSGSGSYYEQLNLSFFVKKYTSPISNESVDVIPSGWYVAYIESGTKIASSRDAALDDISAALAPYSNTYPRYQYAAMPVMQTSTRWVYSYSIYVPGVAPITQHVTVTSGILPPITPAYSIDLTRNDVESTAILYVDGVNSWEQTGSSDLHIPWNNFGGGVNFEFAVTINGETKSVSWGGSEPTPTVTPTPTPTIPTNISNVTNPLDLKEPWDPDILPRPPDPGDLRLPDHIPGLDGLEDLLQNIRNSSTTHFPLYNSSFHSFADKIDDTRSLLVTSVTNFIAVLFSPIYFVIGIITNGIVFLTRVLGGFAAYLIVPGMVFNAVFRIIPGFILNIISIFILLDGIFFILRTILPSLRTKGGT